MHINRSKNASLQHYRIVQRPGSNLLQYVGKEDGVAKGESYEARKKAFVMSEEHLMNFLALKKYYQYGDGNEEG